MAKSKKNKNSKASVKVQDLAPEKNPKGGSGETYAKINYSSAKIGMGDGSVVPAVQNPAALKFKK